MDREAQDRRSRIEKEFVKTRPKAQLSLVLSSSSPKASPGAHPIISNL